MPNTDTDFAQTVLGQFEDISAIVGQYETVENKWGESVPRFCLADIQGEEVIVTDRMNNYHYYGFPFSIDGDKPEIDFACGGKRKKFVYEDYEEGSAVKDGAFDFGEHIANIEENAFAKVNEYEVRLSEIEQEKSELEEKYAQIKSEYDEIKPKYDEYVQAEQQREADELNAQKDAVFAQYDEVLSDSAEFATLKESKDEMSVVDIEKECALLFVKTNGFKGNFSKSSTSSAVVGVLDSDDDVVDGCAHTKYGYVRVGR